MIKGSEQEASEGKQQEWVGGDEETAVLRPQL